MRTLLPVVIHLTAVVLGGVMMAYRNAKTDNQTAGEAVKTDMPCPNGVSA